MGAQRVDCPCAESARPAAGMLRERSAQEQIGQLQDIIAALA